MKRLLFLLMIIVGLTDLQVYGSASDDMDQEDTSFLTPTKGQSRHPAAGSGTGGRH